MLLVRLVPWMAIIASCHTFVELDFMKDKLREYRFGENYTSCSYINVNSPESRDISGWFIRENVCPSVVAGDFFNASGYLPKAEAAFIFVETYARIGEIIRKMQNYSFWSGRAQNHFVICKPMKDTNFLRDVLENIWKHNILNFVVIFVQNTLQVFSYDPFKKEMINMTSTPHHFPDKLKNLNGYQLRVSFFNDFPLTQKTNGEWTGRDYTLLKTVTSMMNATFRLVEPPPTTNYMGAYKDMQSGKSDFCFISHFYKEKIDKELECSYPHEKNGISLLMPVMHRKKTLFLVFQPFTWLLLVTGKIIISLTILLTDKNQQKSLSESVLYVFSCFLGYAFPRFHSKRFIIKFQIIIFVVGSIILRTAFQCFLISCFIKSSPVHQINTITQLQNSDVKIYMSQLLAPFVPEYYDLRKRFIYVTREERMVMLHDKLNTSGAYGMIWTHTNEYVKILNKGQRNILFYGMKEVLVPQYNSYIFKKHSPFLGKFSECLLRERQYMLAKSSDFGTRFKKSSLEEDEEVVLKLQHLQHIFLVLVFGLAASILMFVVELIFFTWCVRIQVVL
ncbi:hypothetical protein MTP99_008768 [Tenebrio molitor]|nr:hypothetical protein MTP99_008768 [Tenebrio molitor]